MNRLGIGINTTKQNKAEFTATPADLPQVGTPGAANGVILAVNQIDDTTLEVTEAIGGVNSSIFGIINVLLIQQHLTTPLVTNQDYVDAVNSILTNQTYLNFSTDPTSVALDANLNDLLEYEQLDNKFQFEVINTETNFSLLNSWKDYVLEGVRFLHLNSYVLPQYFRYAYLDTSGGETGLNLVTYTEEGNPDQTINFTLSDDLVDNTNGLLYTLNNSLLYLLPALLLTRTYRVVNVSILAEKMMPAIIPTMNIYPSEFVYGFDESTEALASFAAENNGLDSQTLPQVLDRYRLANNVKNLQYGGAEESPGNLSGGGIRVADNIFGGHATATALVTFSQQNRQITLKLLYTGSNKPPDPYYDRLANEKLTLHCNILCFKDVANVASLLETLALAEFNVRSIEEAFTLKYEGTSDSGAPYFYSETTFKIDVSDIVVIDNNGEEVTVLDLCTVGGEENQYKAMVFQLQNMKFSSNVRSGTTRQINYIQTGLVTVPTYKGPAFEVGKDMGFFFDNIDSTANSSLKDGVTQMGSSLQFNTNFEIGNPDTSPVTIDFDPEDFGVFFTVPAEITDGGAGINQVISNNSSSTLYYNIIWDLTITDLTGDAVANNVFIRVDAIRTSPSGTQISIRLINTNFTDQTINISGNFLNNFGYNYPLYSGYELTFQYSLISFNPTELSLEFSGTLEGNIPGIIIATEGAPPISQSPPPATEITDPSVTNTTTIRPNFYY